MADSAVVGNKREAAEFFGVSLPTVDSWIRAGCPVVKGGANGVPYELDFAAVGAWRENVAEIEATAARERDAAIQRLQLDMFGDDRLPEIAGSEGLSPAARRELLQAEHLRIRLARESGELVRVEELKIRLAGVSAMLADQLRAVPDMLGRRFGLGRDVVEHIRESIDDALDVVASRLVEMNLLGNVGAAGEPRNDRAA